MKKIVIIGATSAIAVEVARAFAKEGASLALLARNQQRLDQLAQDLSVRGATVSYTGTFDAHDIPSHERILEEAYHRLGEFDAALIAHGELPNQPECQRSVAGTQDAFRSNLLSPIAFLTWLANYFEARKTGTIAVIGSVAGDRGRQSNYIYGAAKGGLTVFLQGLRNRLTPAGVSVTTIKPGFVDTPMISHLPKSPLFASPELVGQRIHKAMKRGEAVVYTPFFWRFIMLIIQHIPECIFRRLKL
jgi:short-subunit dehydrogenase